MARNGSGTYSVVNTFVSGQTITASSHNANWTDIGTEMTNSVAADGQTTMTGPLKAANGTVGAPAVTFGSDTDSGIYRIGANNIGVGVNGAKVLDIGTTGLTVVGGLLQSTNDGGALGASGTAYSDLFLASGGVINWNAADVTITHSANTLTFAGASSGYVLDAVVKPSANDGAALGASGTAWSDLFLASGAVINFNAGNYTLTHSAGALTTSGSLTVGSGFTVSAGSVSFPSGTIANAALAQPTGYVKIATATGGGATYDFTALDDTYDAYMLVISNAKPVTDDVEAWIRVGTGAGPSYQTSGYEYSTITHTAGTQTGIGTTAAAKIIMTRSTANGDVGNASGENFNAVIYFNNPEASDYCEISYTGSYSDALAGATRSFNGAGKYSTAGAITGIRFMFESGNISSGRATLYGLTKA